MKRGNDFKVRLTVYRRGELEDFSDAFDIMVVIYHTNSQWVKFEPKTILANGATLCFPITNADQKESGRYNAIISYKKRSLEGVRNYTSNVCGIFELSDGCCHPYLCGCDKDEVCKEVYVEIISDGKDGITPHIGENGNWWIGTYDTGQPSQGEKGIKGDPGKSAYIIAVENGFKGTEEEFIASLKGDKGDSTYELAVKNGFDGTEEEYLASLKGDKGQSTYELAVENGFDGTEKEFLVSLKGDKGESVYELAVENGFEGTEQEFIASLKGDKGDSTYELAVENGFEGTLQEYLDSLKGDKGESAYELAVENGFEGTEEEYLSSLKGDKGDPGKSAYKYAVEAGYPRTEEEFGQDLVANSNAVVNGENENDLDVSADEIQFKAESSLSLQSSTVNLTANQLNIISNKTTVQGSNLSLEDVPQADTEISQLYASTDGSNLRKVAVGDLFHLMNLPEIKENAKRILVTDMNDSPAWMTPYNLKRQLEDISIGIPEGLIGFWSTKAKSNEEVLKENFTTFNLYPDNATIEGLTAKSFTITNWLRGNNPPLVRNGIKIGETFEITVKITGIPSFGTFKFALGLNSGIEQVITSDGEYTISLTNNTEGTLSAGIYYSVAGECNIRIEQIGTDRSVLDDLSGNGNHIQLYNFAWNENSGYTEDNYLKFDGVDDYGMCESVPVLNDYSIFVVRKVGTKGALASKSIQGGAYGAFIMEYYSVSSGLITYSFGPSTEVESPELITWQTKNSYNGKAINVGQNEDNSGFVIGTIRPNATSFYDGEILRVMLFNRTLSEEEIKQAVNYLDSLL